MWLPRLVMQNLPSLAAVSGQIFKFPAKLDRYPLIKKKKTILLLVVVTKIEMQLLYQGLFFFLEMFHLKLSPFGGV